MTSPRLVGLSGAAGAGKSTAADILIHDYGFTRVKMAGPLKAMLRAIGLTDEEIEGGSKELPCALLKGVTPRHAMISLGCGWGRDAIHPDLWTGLWQRQAQEALSRGHSVVVDDVRFANEAEAVRALGGTVLRIRRPEVEGRITHASEAHDFVPDAEVWNAGEGIGALRAAIQRVAD